MGMWQDYDYNPRYFKAAVDKYPHIASLMQATLAQSNVPLGEE
jgi:hypothetical protein